MRVATTILLLVVMAGCAGSPTVRRPDVVDVPGTWSAGAEPGTAVADAWWSEFADPRLDALIAEALEHNRDLRATAARLDAAAAQARIAGAGLKPTLSAALNGSRQRQLFIGLPIPSAGIPSATFTNLGLSLGASYEVDLWGRVRAGTRAAVADFEAARFEYDAARLSISGQTAKAWFAVVEAAEQLRLAEETAASFRESTGQVRSRYESGIRPPLDLRLALTRQAEAEALVENRRGQLDATTRVLEVLVGRYPAGAIESGEPLPDLPGPVAAGLPADLVSQRPDLAAAERRLAAADQRFVVAKRSLYPRLSLTGSDGTASNELEDLLDGDFRVWNLVASLTVPLFQGGRLRAGVDLARAGQDEGLARYAASVLGAYAEVEGALAAERILTDRENRLAEAAIHSRAAEALALDRYRSGLEGYLAVLQSQTSALAAESQLLSVRRTRLDNRVDLHLALGGGFELPREEENETARTDAREDGES